jgi:MFS family permease
MYPLPEGEISKFDSIDLNSIQGLPKIWHKNRIMFYSGTPEEKASQPESDVLKKILLSSDIELTLKRVKHQIVEPFDIELSKGSVSFDKGVKVGSWNIFWKADKTKKDIAPQTDHSIVSGTEIGIGFKITLFLTVVISLFFMILYLSDRKKMIKKGTLDPMSEGQKNFIVVFIAVTFLVGFFMLANSLSPEFLREMGYQLPLPVFTFFIALVDGFNPCNMFVLTFLMALIVSASHSRLRIYIVGYTFVAVVYVIYFLFMAAWLNIFKYIGFVDPLRVTIAVIAIIAGLINCKELIFFKKGISLTTSDAGRGFLQKKTRKVKDVIKNGSIPVLLISSVTLAFFASLIELPCTAGFPIVYTTVLSGLEIAESSFTHYFWIAMYNLFYIIPLAVIIFIFGYTFRGKAVSETAVQRMKFIGGFIMLVLGIVLLVNPAMIGIGG